MTQIYGVVARDASHSLSPVIQNAAFQKLGIDAEYRRFSVDSGQGVTDLAQFVEMVRNEEIAGFSVTTPYKEVIVDFLDELDADAQKIGAVNTVKNEDGVLKGYNFDGDGAMLAVQASPHFSDGFSEKHILVIGAGGAARAIIYTFCKAGARIIIFNRTYSKAVQLAQQFSCTALSQDALFDISYDMIINATSCGMTPDENSLPLPEDCLSKLFSNKTSALVFDIVYTPFETRFLKLAKKAGWPVLSGDRMLLYQGAKQFELWTGVKAPLSPMFEALQNSLFT